MGTRENHNGNNVIALIGSYDQIQHRFTRETVLALDYGLDFYAPQTLETPDGRRILIAWKKAWENSHLYPDDAKWNGMLTVPRELTLGEKRLIQQPVREAPVRWREGRISIRIIMDRFSVELFINGGEQVMSSCIYTPQESDGVFFEAEGSGYFTVEKYELLF